MDAPVFLSANWQYLIMLNYEIDPKALEGELPPFTEIDYFEGKALVSIVGFLFSNTRVLGLKWPGHINFEEVNLRYYVRRFDGAQWKRGVGFVSEIVPKKMIALLANRLFNEHYSVADMNHTITRANDILTAEYKWKMKNGPWNSMRVSASAIATDILPGSAEEFIFEHYFGYNALGADTTIEYTVEHPRWQVYPVMDYLLDCDVENLYGIAFNPFITGKKPHSVFIARGSGVRVGMPVRIKKNKSG